MNTLQNKLIAFIILLIISPLLIIIAILNLFINGYPITFSAKRIGKDGKEFMIYKFRTMPIDKDVANNNYSIFLRKTNLDELLQFFNVIKGDMNIVGPRPHDILEDVYFNENILDYKLRYKVKPGVTGLAAVNGNRGGTDLKLIIERTKYDLEYIKKKSILFDLKIILKTIVLIFYPNH